MHVSTSTPNKLSPRNAIAYHIMIHCMFSAPLNLTAYVDVSVYENSGALPCISNPTINPKSPSTELKISMTRILTNLQLRQ